MERMEGERFMQMERRRLKERREGKLRRALRDKRASHMRRGRKEASSYVLRRKQGDRAEPARSAQRPRPESMVAASSRGLHRRTSRCVRPPKQDQKYGVSAALRDGPPRHPLRGAARPRRGRSRPHPLDGERYPRRTACYPHGRDHPPTRRRVRVSGALLTEVRDGKIVREWTYWDQLSLLAQLGITDQPGLFLSPEGF